MHRIIQAINLLIYYYIGYYDRDYLHGRRHIKHRYPKFEEIFGLNLPEFFITVILNVIIIIVALATSKKWYMPMILGVPLMLYLFITGHWVYGTLTLFNTTFWTFGLYLTIKKQ